MSQEASYLQALGRRILSEANDLKRTPEALANDLGLGLDVVKAVIEGRAEIAEAQKLLLAMSEFYPISLADVWVDLDDTDHGVRVMTASDSQATSRIFDRKDRAGSLTEYYEYRDTAMSRTAPFKPEWIAELRFVDDADPDNADVAYNNGHLMHQTTFFIGPVNFYWESGGRRHCAEMNTGDSNYITPFVPHSFASRDRNQRGLIVAVTYAGQVGRSLREFINVGAAAAEAAAGDLRNASSYRNRLARHLAAESMTAGELAERLVDVGIVREQADLLASGAAMPTAEEVDAMAKALSVRPVDIMVCAMAADEDVVLRRRGEGPVRLYPDGNRPAYRLAELARTRQQPYLKGFDVTVLGGPGAEFSHSLHEYVYNYGSAPVDLHWGIDASQRIEPGGSAYVRPFVRHSFAHPDGAEEGQLAMIRIPGLLNDQTFDEYATFAPEGRTRVAAETRRWF